MTSTPQKYGYDEHEKRIDALLDKLSAVQTELAICKELSQPEPIELQIQAQTLNTCVASLTAAHGKLLAFAQYVQNCRVHQAQPTLWELELIMDDIHPRGPIL